MSPALSPRGLRRLSTDWAWGGMGVTLATASASFAGYMIVTAPAEVTGFGSRDFNVFVQFDRRRPALAALHAPPLGGMPAAAPSSSDEPPPDTMRAALRTPPASPDIDLAPTGSIPREPSVGREPHAPGSLAEFRLRNVVGDHAIIEHHSSLTLVRPGSLLAGAGEVLSIERQGGGWIVRTTSGVIGGS